MTKMATTIEENRMKTNETSVTSKPFSDSFAAAAARNAQHSTDATAENASQKKIADKKSEAAKPDAALLAQQATATPAAAAPTAATLSNPMAFTLKYGGNAGAENDSVAATQQAEPSPKAPSPQGNDSPGVAANHGTAAGTASSMTGKPSASAGAAETVDAAEDGSSAGSDPMSRATALTNTAVQAAGNAEATTDPNGASSQEMAAASSADQTSPVAGMPQGLDNASLASLGLASPEQMASRAQNAATEQLAPSGTAAGGAAVAAPTGTKKSGSQQASTAAPASPDALAGTAVKPHESAPGPQPGMDLTAQQTAHNVTLANASAHAGSSGSQANDASAAGEAAPAPPRAAEAAPQWNSAAQPMVHSAQLIQAMHGSEMRMGMSSAEFGNISITASVTHQTLTAQIALDHAGLTRALTAQIPGMEAKLGNAYGLQSRVEVRDGSSTAQGGSGGRQPDQPRTYSNFAETGGKAAGADLSSVPAALLPASSTRLDVLI